MKLSLGFLIVLLIFSTEFCFSQNQESTPADVTIDRNGVLLKGKFHLAEGTGFFPTVLILQGFPGNETDVLGIGKNLSQAGINALTFNYSGTFQSQGKSNFSNTQMDIEAAFGFLHNSENINRFKIDTTCLILGGWSYGGGMAMTYAIMHPEIKSVFSLAGVDWGEYYEEYLRNPEFKKTIDANVGRMASSPEVRFDTGALPNEIAEKGIIRLDSSYFLKKSAPRLVQKNLLIVGGWDDPQATVDQYILPLYRALKNAKAEHVAIEAFQDGHYFRNSRQELAQAIIAWVKGIQKEK